MADQAATQGYGGFWIRFLAYLVDSVIVVVILFLAVFAAIFLGEAAAALIPAICLAVPVLYWGLMQASARQATFGKALLGLKVTDISGGRIPVLRSLAREVAKYISAIPLMIGFILAAFTKRKQALHDFFVSTTVVREGRAHVVAALMVGVFGWLAPAALMMFIGGTVLAVMMGIMGGGLMPETMKEAQKQAASPAPMPAKPAPAAPKQATPASAPAKPLPPGPPAMPPMAGPVADIQAALAARLSLVDKPGSTRAGPAILELDSLFGSSFAIKTYLPLRGEFDGDGVSIMLNRVVDAKGAELYDPSHSLESPFFQRVSLNAEASPEEHLDGTRRVSLKSGGGGQGLERAEGVLKLAIPAKATILSFEAADIGKPQSAHGVEVTVQSVKGNVFTFEYKGDASRVFSTKGFGADAKRVPIAGRGGGGQRMTYTFARPVSRIQVAVVENLTQHSFPFTLTRTSLAGPAGAPPAVKTTGLPATPREPAKPAPTAKPAPAPAPTVVAQARQPEKPLAAEPAAAPRKAAEPMAAPMQKAAPAQAAAPVQATQGPLIPGPRFNDLVTAVLYRDAKAVEDLLAFGKWPDKADSRGMTPLMLAAMLGDAPIAEALLKAGANPNRPGPGGDTAMSIARERKDTGMVGLLRQHGAR